MNDLNEIWEYIVSELCNVNAAEHTIKTILDTVERLENFSALGAPLSSITSLENDYRFLVSKSYLIFYRINGHEIYIDRILYSRRNYMYILFPDLPPSESET